MNLIFVFYNYIFPVREGIYHTCRRRNEDLNAAITRAAFEACQRNCKGYSIDCSSCGESLADCEKLAIANPIVWQRLH